MQDVCQRFSRERCINYIIDNFDDEVRVNTGNDYCEALGLVCEAMWDDAFGLNCNRGTAYDTCDADGGDTVDHGHLHCSCF